VLISARNDTGTPTERSSVVPYRITATRTSPALVLNLLDVSLSMREKLNRVPKIEHVNQAIEKDVSEEAKNAVAWDTEAENQDDRGGYKVFSAANLIVVVTWMIGVVVVLVILALIARKDN
jgi:hypothetical protein